MLRLGFDQLEKVLLTLQAPDLYVRPEYCSRLRHKNSKCSHCSDSCPTRAIAWAATLKVDTGKCTSCGICANVCPNGVFEALKPADGEILAKVKLLLDDQREIVFGCANAFAKDQTGLIKVPCLARLDEAILVGSVALGAKSIWLVNGSCQGCKYEPSYIITRNTMSAANEIISMFGFSKRIFLQNEKTEVKRSGENHVKPILTSRREFFRTMARGSQRAGSLLAVSMIDSYSYRDDDRIKKESVKLPIHLPVKRRLLLNYMKVLGRPTEKAIMAESPLFCHFEIDERCTGCQMCAFFCPTGALVNVEKEGKAGVRFKISDCTACGLCQEICYKQAVQLRHSINFNKVIDDDTEEIMMREESFVFPGRLFEEN